MMKPGDTVPMAERVRSSLDDSYFAPLSRREQERPDTVVDPMLGARLGNYEITFILGKGAYGTVYKARDIHLDRLVAIKFLHEFLDARHEAMFLREARAIAALGKHPAIVQIYEWSEYQGRNYFVLEFVPSNAAMLLRVNPGGLPPEKALGIATDCADGLAWANRQDIIHRDVKPANILLELEGGQTKLADFGVARFFDPASGSSSDMPGGTPRLHGAGNHPRRKRPVRPAVLLSCGSPGLRACGYRWSFYLRHV
jgi:serine/threonine protein kinase